MAALCEIKTFDGWTVRAECGKPALEVLGFACEHEHIDPWTNVCPSHKSTLLASGMECYSCGHECRVQVQFRSKT